MNEIFQSAMSHLTTSGMEFPWWQIYTTWATVALIFIVDNILRLKYNKKLKFEYEHLSDTMSMELSISNTIVKEQKASLNKFKLRYGDNKSLLDVTAYKVCTNIKCDFVGTCNDSVTSIPTYAYGDVDLNNKPVLKE